MIKKNNQTIGFIYKNNQNIDKIYKNNQLIFEQGFVREDSGNVPLSTTHQAIGKNLKDYKIYGNSVQDGTPTPSAPIEIESVGDLITDTNDINYGKYKIPVKVKSKNLFDDTTLSNKWINISGSVVDLSKANCKRFECVEGETYTLSASYETKHANNIIVMAFYDSNDTLISRNVVSNLQYEEITATAPQNSKYLYAGRYTIEPQTIQLEKSDIATEYEPHVEPVITNIYLDEPLRKIEDYSDYIDFKNSKVIRNIAKNTIGTVYDSTVGSIDENMVRARFNDSSRKVINDTQNIQLLSEKLEGVSYSNYVSSKTSSKECITMSRNNKTCFLKLSKTRIGGDSLSDMNNYLTNNPINYYRILDIPTEETILLPNIPTIKGTTIFEVDTEIQPSSMYIKYKGK